MVGLPVQSAGRRFIKKFGFAFGWAAFFGALFGGLAFMRVDRAQLDQVQPWYRRVQLLLERLELVTYDWRVRELGRRGERSDAVVAVAIDDDTLASAREASAPELAVQPWPREVLGGMAEELWREGASLVLVDLPLTDLSPRTCASGKSDDEAFRASLDRSPGRSLLTFGWSAQAARPADRELRPYLLLVERGPTLDELRESIRRVLASRAPAYVIPEGDGMTLWAAAASEQAAQRLADEWHLKSPRIRLRTAAEQKLEVPASRLLAALAEVQIEGLDISKLLRARSLEPPVPVLLSQSSHFGAATLPADPDGQVRGFPLVVSFSPREGERYVLPSAPLAAAMALAGTRKLAWRDGRLWIGDRYSVPMDESGYALLRWDAAEPGRGGKGALKRSVSAWKVLVNWLDARQRQGLARHDNDVDGRVALLMDVSGRQKAASTPIGPLHSGAVLAQGLVNILRGEGVVRVDRRIDFALTVGMAFVGALLAIGFSSIFRARAGPVTYFLALLAASAVYAFAAHHVFVTQAKWVALASPLLALSATFLAAVGYAAALERRIREFIFSALGRVVNPEVARRVESDLALMRPERRAVTVYFSDIEGFTAISDQMPPERVASLLNAYLTEMTAVVSEGRGQVDKYIGDAVMAFWGAPVRLSNHAEAGCESALRMLEQFERRRAEWEKWAGAKLELRAGLNSGEVVVGDFGSDLKSNYTVMGEAVALAARLENLNKWYGTHILVGEATAAAASRRFVFREADRVRVKGATAPVRIHELVGRKGQLGDRQRLVDAYGQAIEAYHARRFGEALERFEMIAAEFDDALSSRYAARCRYLFENDPPAEWDGVYVGPE